MQLGLILKRVPGFLVERTNGRRDAEVARQVARFDQLDHIRLVFQSVIRAVHPTIELQGNQRFEGHNLWLGSNLLGFRERHTTTPLEDPAGRQQIDRDAIAPVANSAVVSRHTTERATQVCCQEFDRVEDIWDDQIDVERHAVVAVFLNSQAADQQMRNIPVREHRDGRPRGLLDASRAGILSQHVCSGINHVLSLPQLCAFAEKEL